MAELLVDDKQNVFLYNGQLGERVWSPRPVTRFRFKRPIDNEWIAEHLRENRPKCGIVFNNKPYIGTSDGFICGDEKETQRVPELLVDTEVFIDDYPFRNARERRIFRRFTNDSPRRWDYLMRVAKKKGKGFVNRMLDIKKIWGDVVNQERNIDRYLDKRMDWLAIIGFVVDNDREDHGEPVLYDACRLGIHETRRGKRINSLVPYTLHQLSPKLAGFVPGGCPPAAPLTLDIEDRIERRTERECVDYRSLWTLNGRHILVKDICPRDGSGYAGAKFVTDGETTAISHGDCPDYKLDIRSETSLDPSRSRTIRLEPQDTPWRLLLKDGQVICFYNDHIVNHTNGARRSTEFPVTSVSESGLCSSFNEKEGVTLIHEVLNWRLVDKLTGKYRFLPQYV